mmetsp:Transcript_83752/g.148157  ORF Transcript_83752/g.148157 Transcript_83752/m.148157 type:complete len:288 (-) Transcript_83752:206-1069(-)
MTSKSIVDTRCMAMVMRHRMTLLAVCLLCGLSSTFVPGAENMPCGAPKLYGYDHSHYTVRCRMALGLKKVPYRMIWVAEDDEETPMQLVGKKITPIIEFPGEAAMMESSDIINRIDSDSAYGPPVLKPKTERPEVDAWIKKLSVPMRNLGRPRYIRSSMLPEFRSRSARERFVTTHPLPDPETGVTLSKAEWAELPKAFRDTRYENYWQDSERQLRDLNEALQGVDGLIASAKHVSPQGLSWDDILFFSRLRGITLIKGSKLPSSLENYLETMSEMTDVPLLTQMAI